MHVCMYAGMYVCMHVCIPVVVCQKSRLGVFVVRVESVSVCFFSCVGMCHEPRMTHTHQS